MDVDYHLPCGIENGGRAKTLPILYVELSVHFAQPAVRSMTKCAGVSLTNNSRSYSISNNGHLTRRWEERELATDEHG
jgi:hypothetical protein